jgi:hypothetical protein
MGFEYLPIRERGSPVALAPYRRTWTPGGAIPESFPAASSIAVGDLDGNGFDEAVFSLSDGRMARLDWRGTDPDPGVEPITFVNLRSSHPSAPAVGDLDGDGTIEIALWDDANFYVYEHNGALRTNWPQPLRPTALGDYPSLVFDERLVSPLIAEINGDDRVEVLFPRADGAIHAFDPGGDRLEDFPRAVPDGMQATPAIGDLTAGGELDLVCFGSLESITSVESVTDSLATTHVVSLSVQSLPNSTSAAKRDWPGYERDLTRQGRWVRSEPPESSDHSIEPGSFKVYPNPVRGRDVHARVILNREASVRVEVYTLEGEKALSKNLTFNEGNVVHTPFDETVDVSGLKSGIYVLRLEVGTENGTESFVASFAILR